MATPARRELSQQEYEALLGNPQFQMSSDPALQTKWEALMGKMNLNNMAQPMPQAIPNFNIPAGNTDTFTPEQWLQVGQTEPTKEEIDNHFATLVANYRADLAKLHPQLNDQQLDMAAYNEMARQHMAADGSMPGIKAGLINHRLQNQVGPFADPATQQLLGITGMGKGGNVNDASTLSITDLLTPPAAPTAKKSTPAQAGSTTHTISNAAGSRAVQTKGTNTGTKNTSTTNTPAAKATAHSTGYRYDDGMSNLSGGTGKPDLTSKDVSHPGVAVTNPAPIQSGTINRNGVVRPEPTISAAPYPTRQYMQGGELTGPIRSIMDTLAYGLKSYLPFGQ